MDGLAQTYLWDIYENPKDVVALPPAWSVLKPGLSVLTLLAAMGGSLSPVWAAVAYISTPPGYALNIRWGPSTNYGIYRTLLRGTPIDITGTYRNGWAQLSDGTWAAGNYVAANPPFSLDGTRTEAVVISGIPGLNARWGPGTEYGIYRTLAPGERVILTGRSNSGWVQLNDGTWVVGSYLQSTGTSPSPQAPSQAVVQLQDRLKELGYLAPTFSSSGIYDATTQAAVRQFQQDNGLRPDGVVGDATWQALYQNSQADGNRPGQDLPQEAIADLQTLLKNLNYLPSDYPANGTYDATTQDAVRRFKLANGLPANAVVDEATWQALYAAQAQAQPQPQPTPTLTASPSPTASPTQPPPSGSEQQAQIVADIPEGETVRVFDGPGSEYDIIDSLPNGAQVTLTGRQSGNWTQLQSGGWVFSMWVQPI